MNKPDLSVRLNELFFSDTWAFLRTSFQRMRSEALADIMAKKDEHEACMQLRLIDKLEQDIRTRCSTLHVQVEPFLQEA